MSRNYSVILIILIGILVGTYYFLSVSIIFEKDYQIFTAGPRYPPTKGEVWPKPQHQVYKSEFYSLNPARFKIKVTHETCGILVAAVERYTDIAKRRASARRRGRGGGRASRSARSGHEALELLHVAVIAPCEEYPHMDMDESYNLTISSVSMLRSQSVWGAMRGLETFAQMLHLSDDTSEILIQASVITDAPAYQYRGLLLDTSRHFISVANILRTLDAMAINKMNVFHWHIVDDQSFPYESERFPEISKMGAYDPSMVYTEEDIRKIVQYARERGVRVVPEFDVPGHTRSWGNAYPELLVECYKKGQLAGLGPMNPTTDFTYDFLEVLVREVRGRFPDEYFHLGGDEVSFDCWESNPYLRRYMRKNRLDVSGLHALFMTKAIPLLGNDTKLIVWQEVFDNDVPLNKDTLIQVWKYYWDVEMVKVLRNGYKVVFSASWYLDYLEDTWQTLYRADPRQMVTDTGGDPELAAGVVGGEACMWGEMVDDTNVISRTWPRTSAVAERLWSSDIGAAPDYETHRRLEEHTCRMVQRGIDAQPPSGPGFCV